MTFTVISYFSYRVRVAHYYHATFVSNITNIGVTVAMKNAHIKSCNVKGSSKVHYFVDLIKEVKLLQVC